MAVISQNRESGLVGSIQCHIQSKLSYQITEPESYEAFRSDYQFSANEEHRETY